MQYSRDGENWNNYTGEITYTEKGTIYARLINRLEETGQVASKEIANIDREKPNEATVSFSSTTTDVETSITATVTQTDEGNSGVDFTKSKWKYVADSEAIGTNPSSYPGTFTKSPEVITLNATMPGTYYLHVLTIDNAGNVKETIKGPITVTKAMAKVGEIVTKENKEYTKNGTAIIPVGFAIKPGCDDVSNGLVISDVANDTNDTGNQFVWVPVPNFANFKILRWGFTTLAGGDWAEPYSAGYPNEVNEYNAMKDSVNKNKGFYIGRYEASKEGSNATVKKNKYPWVNVGWGNSMSDPTGGCVITSRNFKNGKAYAQSVTSTLCYGIQWDATMQFFDSNYLTGNCSTSSYVRNSAKGNYSDYLINTGSNNNYAYKNIYDMAGNALECTMEASYNMHRVWRGGGTSTTSTERFAACRNGSEPNVISNVIGTMGAGFRICLYINI